MLLSWKCYSGFANLVLNQYKKFFSFMNAKIAKNPKNLSLEQKIQSFEGLVSLLVQAKNAQKKLEIIDQQSAVQESLSHFKWLSSYFNDIESELAIKSVIAIGQGPRIFGDDPLMDVSDCVRDLLKVLIDVQKFYAHLGGILGYHLTVLKLILAKNDKYALPDNICYHKPIGVDLSQDSLEVRRAVRWGLEGLPNMAEIYPVGGAGDRLNLHDSRNGEALPVAVLQFCGRTLLEGLMRDLQAREYLYYKIYGKRVIIPIAMMTSHEKNNHQQIISICEKTRWFGRPREAFNLFIQALVPVITLEGDWVMQAPFQLMLKPGGHGVIWKLAQENGVFDWFEKQKKSKAILRQINNPIAGVDEGLIAFSGFGHHYDKAFGYASCHRLLNASEGMDVLVETKTLRGYDYRISNLEYTEFEQKGVSDLPEESGSPYSLYPANTNILFVDFEEIKAALLHCPLPGMLINMKSTVSLFDKNGSESKIPAGRLESTMQNIADYIIDSFPHPLEKKCPYDLRSFITYNERRKTISVVKKAYDISNSLLETPEGCFYELLQNHYDLFVHHCGMQLPDLNDEKSPSTAVSRLKIGLSFVIHYHPSLGPLYQIIAQKIRRGTIVWGSEMQLEIAELEIQDLYLEGSLLIFCEDVMGSKNSEEVLIYNEFSGKCTLFNVRVENKGINREAANQYWKNEITRHESLRIVLKGDAEFFASNVTFKGNFQIEVPCGHRMTAFMQEDQVLFHLEKIKQPSWYWKYAFDSEERIKLLRYPLIYDGAPAPS